jgi:hypothetical protein
MVSVRVAPILLLAAAVPIFAAKKATSSHPPRQLHRAGDHYTAYNPPDPGTYPAGAKTYTIKRGDTLWALAQQNFGNAYLWPQLWESNTWVTDAHWIYPGDVLLIEGDGAQAASNGETSTTTTTTTTATTAAAEEPAETASVPADHALADGTHPPPSLTPVPLGTEADVYCYGYLGEAVEPMPNHIASYEDVEMTYETGAVKLDIGGSIGDLVYIAGGTSTGIVAGETYLIVEPGELVPHPATKDTIGRHYDYVGQVRVLCADDKAARGIITESCMDVHIGARLKPLPQIPIPLARIPSVPGFCDPASGKTAGYIVNAQGGWNGSLGEGLLIEVNLGREDALQPGDILTVWRPSIMNGQPRQVLGEIGILTTEGHTATGKIVAMRYSMQVGDRVERQ